MRGIVKPAVRFEVWLPLRDWNGKFQGTGHGGYNGGIVYSALATGLNRHYATANTDMGHLAATPDPGSWALHHPELVVDQGSSRERVPLHWAGGDEGTPVSANSGKR